MVEMWSPRVVLPALLFLVRLDADQRTPVICEQVNPVFGWTILSGEQKGSDVAMAQLERR